MTLICMPFASRSAWFTTFRVVPQVFPKASWTVKFIEVLLPGTRLTALLDTAMLDVPYPVAAKAEGSAIESAIIANTLSSRFLMLVLGCIRS